MPNQGLNMNRFELSTLCLIATLGIAGCDNPEANSHAASEQVAARQADDVKACDRRSGNAKDVCLKEAEARANIAVAENALADDPSDARRAELALANAEGSYGVALERCDDSAGNAADVCRKEAESAYAAAKADAALAATIVDAQSTEREATSEAAEDARETTDAARDDAADVKRAADYALAQERCDAFAGAMKSECLDRAEADHAPR
jgi:hypothetical protein